MIGATVSHYRILVKLGGGGAAERSPIPIWRPGYRPVNGTDESGTRSSRDEAPAASTPPCRCAHFSGKRITESSPILVQ